MSNAAIAVVVVVVAFLAFIMLSGGGGLENLITPGAITINIPEAQQTVPVAPTIIQRPSLSSIFHSIIDPVDPVLIGRSHNQCILLSGSWFDNSERFGCFSMPTGAFDADVMCIGPGALYLENICRSIEGAQWACNVNSVGCYY